MSDVNSKNSKKAFTEAADGDDPETDDDVFVAGNDGEAPEDKRRREEHESAQHAHKHQQDEVETAQKEALSKKQQSLRDEFANPGMRKKASRRVFKGISDKGEWIHVRARGQKDPRTGQVHMTDQQLQEILIMAVMQKGWTEIYFYRGKTSKIDKQTTVRANEMLAKMKNAGIIPADVPCTCHEHHMHDIEPWKKGLFEKLHRSNRKWHSKRDGSAPPSE